MAPGPHPVPAGTTRHSEPARRAVNDERRVALFASGLQRSDAPSTAMAAEAIMATVRGIGIHGCVSRMAQEFGDHPDAAAERMRWICQLAAEVPARSRLASAGRASSGPRNESDVHSDHRGAATGPGPGATAAGVTT